MNWMRKIAISLTCLALLGGSVDLWPFDQDATANQKKLAEDAKQTRTRAERGDPKAQDELATMYYRGRGVPQDYSQAVQWWRRAADQGDAKGEYSVGNMYHQGKGVPHDDAEAVRWCQKAADQGLAIAQDAIGIAYYSGNGVPKDLAKALLWFRKAADQDYADAQYNLGYMYLKGLGVSQDYRQAIAWIRKAADQNYAKAQDELGKMYYNGQGVDADYIQAAEWYRKAADQGDAIAQSDLGFLYLSGEGVPQDLAQADKWLRKAAAQGNPRAKWALSREPKNLHKAWNLWLLIAFLGATWIATEFLLKRRWVLLYTLRKYVSLVFATTACVFLVAGFPRILRVTRPQSKLVFFLGSWLSLLVLAALSAVLLTACWTTVRGRQSARGWGIAASLIYVLTPIWPIISFAPTPWRAFGFLLVVGIVGLVAFSHRLAQSDDPARTLEITHNPGDGTSAVLNAITAFLSILAAIWAYSWWRNWVTTNGILVDAWNRALVWVLVLLVIVILHELGHTVAGLALGMKLRGFVVGPFQWHIRDGKWEFQFKLTKPFPGGATLVVPATVDFPRWRELVVTAGGALANLLSGALALWIVITSKSNALQHTRGALGLFAAWSLIVAVGNLLPFRALEFYSDGAQIYQILSKGPWGDLHRVSAIAASTLFTLLRPRDYDIQMILRAGQGITRGPTAMWLRLVAYAYYLDQDRLLEAGEAFRQSALIYQECAEQVPAELLTEFVFASAYVLRDSGAAHQWWVKMEAKKPTRFNADYWRAASALHWIEGNLKEANEAWAKGNTLAQKLPHAGAYDFDRDCCFKLRQVIDQALVAKAAPI